MRQWALSGAILAVSAGVNAAPLALGDDELRVAVSGKVVKIDTPLGLPLTVNYGANGIMVGTAGSALAAYLGAARDRGRWSVRNGKLCQKWFKWLASDETCMTVRQEGLKIHWHADSGKSGTATIEPGTPVLAGVSASGLGAPLPVAPSHPGRPADASTDRVPDGKAVASAAGSDAPIAPFRTDVEAAAQPARLAPTAELARATTDNAPRLTLASLSQEIAAQPTLPIAAPADQAVLAGTTGDPILPMRWIVDHVSASMFENRWCLANVFGTAGATLPGLAGPGLTGPAARSATAPAIDFARPSLLTIAEEQASPAELPLYDASCLTPEPSLHTVSKTALHGP